MNYWLRWSKRNTDAVWSFQTSQSKRLFQRLKKHGFDRMVISNSSKYSYLIHIKVVTFLAKKLTEKTHFILPLLLLKSVNKSVQKFVQKTFRQSVKKSSKKSVHKIFQKNLSKNLSKITWQWHACDFTSSS